MGKLKFDVYNFFNVLQEGYLSKTLKVEKALAKLSSAFNVIGVMNKHVYSLNEDSGKLYRMVYDVTPTSVKFSDPVEVTLHDDTKRFTDRQKGIIENIIEALASDDKLVVESLKERLFELIREELKFKGILNTEITGKSIYSDEKIKKLVGECLKKAPGGLRRIFAEHKPDYTPLNWLFKNGSIEVPLYKKMLPVESRDKIVKRQILEARKEAKALYKNPTFKALALRIEKKKDEAEDYVEILENFQEYFTLTAKEKMQLFNKIYEGRADVDRVVDIVANLQRLAEHGIPSDLRKLEKVINAEDGFAKAVKLMESELNTGVYSNIDLTSMYNLLESIISEGNQLLSPEMMFEFKKAQIDLKNMMESGLYDSGNIATIVNLIAQYSPETIA